MDQIIGVILISIIGGIVALLILFVVMKNAVKTGMMEFYNWKRKMESTTIPPSGTSYYT